VNPSSMVFAAITVVLNGSAQLLLRQAAMTGAAPNAPLTLIRNAWFMCGLVAYAVSVLTWLLVLKRVPLAVAAPFVAVVYVMVPLASRVLFSDQINPRMWVGMLLVVCGVTLVAQGAPAASDRGESKGDGALSSPPDDR
jgi:undecaprenyl phosphate-alpha-L-ara4N flippase subunit ArnE